MANQILRRRVGTASKRGQAGMFLALSLPVLFGLLGMVVDFGWAYWRKEAAKTAATAAASAVVASAGSTVPTTQASTACPSTIDTSKPWNVGCDFAIHNGFTNGANNRTVSVQIGSGSTGIPISGVSPTSYWVSATVTESIPTLFSYLLGFRSTAVTARSTMAVYNASGGGCVYALNPTMDGGINMSNGSLSSNCGIFVASNNAKAIDASNGHISTTGSAKTNVVGTCDNGGACTEVTPTVNSNCGCVVTDPFALMTAPSTTGMTTYGAVNVNGGTVTISPGIYTGLITANNGTLLVKPGTYVLQAGIDINGATVSEASTGGELFYITGGQFDISSGTVTLNAQTTGTYQGILLFQSASDTNAVIMSDGNLTVSGAIYAKKSQLQLTDGTFTNSTIVVDNIKISNGTTGASINGGANTIFNPPNAYMVE